jgi:hypothetical protein
MVSDRGSRKGVVGSKVLQVIGVSDLKGELKGMLLIYNTGVDLFVVFRGHRMTAIVRSHYGSVISLEPSWSYGGETGGLNVYTIICNII